MIWTKVDLTWREVLEDVGGEILGDDHHLAPGSTQVAILVLVLRRKVLKVDTQVDGIPLAWTHHRLVSDVVLGEERIDRWKPLE